VLNDKKEVNRKVKHLFIPGIEDAVLSMENAQRAGNINFMFSPAELAEMSKPVKYALSKMQKRPDLSRELSQNTEGMIQEGSMAVDLA
jgi:hypothetical protein